MIKIILSIFILLAVAFANPQISYADQYGQGTYGQGVVLGKGGEYEIIHEPVGAGLKEDLAKIGLFALVASGTFYFLFKREEEFDIW